MTIPDLTSRAPGAPSRSAPGRERRRFIRALATVIGLAAACSGCINIKAPDKPIVIQLDINIRAEVLYALAEDAANTIEENKDIF